LFVFVFFFNGDVALRMLGCWCLRVKLEPGATSSTIDMEPTFLDGKATQKRRAEADGAAAGKRARRLGSREKEPIRVAGVPGRWRQRI
jgi:hypothetical protein